VDITTETLQGFWDDAWDSCAASANSFRDQLRAYEKAANRQFSVGSIASVSKNSANQSYRGPGVGSYTVVQIANTWRTLINLFDRIKAEVDAEISADDTQKPPDDYDPTVYERGLLILGNQPVTEYSSDFTDLLLPPTIAPPVPFGQ